MGRRDAIESYDDEGENVIETVNGRLHLGGVPTEPDVDLLFKAFGVPEEGVLISYASIAKVIGHEWRETRFRTVTDAWARRLLNKHNVMIKPRAGEGFVRLTEAQRSNVDQEEWVSRQRQAMRRVRDMGRVRADALDEKQRTEHGRARRIMEAHAQDTRKASLALSPPEATRSIRALPEKTKE